MREATDRARQSTDERGKGVKRPYSVQLELMSMVMAMLYEQMKEQFDFAEVDKILNRLEELTVELETVAGM